MASKTKKKKYTFFNQVSGNGSLTSEEATLYFPAIFCCGTLISLCFSTVHEELRVGIVSSLVEFGVVVCLLWSCVRLVEKWIAVQPEVGESDSSTSCASLPSLSKHRTCAVQTETKNLRRASQIVRQKHENEVRKIKRDMRLIRRKFSEKFKKLKKEIKEKDEELIQLQLLIPNLLRQRSTLLAEKDAIDKQVEEENVRYENLNKKFQKLHAQLAEFGSNSALCGLTDYAASQLPVSDNNNNNNNNNNNCSSGNPDSELYVVDTDSSVEEIPDSTEGSGNQRSVDDSRNGDSDFWMDDNIVDVSNTMVNGDYVFDTSVYRSLS